MKFLLLLLFFFGSFKCHAQFPQYYVFLIKGNVTVLNNSKKKVPLRQNDFLYETDKILFQQGAELTLVDHEKRFFNIYGRKEVPVKDLAKLFSAKKNTGITVKYLELLWDELLDPQESSSKVTNRNVGAVWGGISRGETCVQSIFPTDSVLTSIDTITFKWHPLDDKLEYELYIYNDRKEPIAVFQTADTSLSVKVSGWLTGKRSDLFWRLKSKTDTCGHWKLNNLSILDRETEEKLIQSLIKPGASLEDQLECIQRLYNKRLIPVAKLYFEKLVNSDPTNKPLLHSYIAFLIDNGYSDDALALLKGITKL